MSSTIADAITALQGRVADAYTAVSGKGGALPATQNTANLPTAIASIPAGVPSSIVKDIIEGGTELLVIPEGVVNSRRYAFNYYNNVAVVTPFEVVLPSTLKYLGQYCFSNSALKNIETNFITNVYERAFQYCNKLENVTFNLDGTISFGTYIFYSCSSLKNVRFNCNVQSITNCMFYSCSALEEIDFSMVTQIPTLSYTNAFTNVPTTCKIKVPANLYQSWITKTNWSTLYANGYNFVAV